MMRCFSDEGALIEKLDMPLEEQARIFGYFMTHYKPRSHDAKRSRNAYMASLYYALGDYENADREMQKMLDRRHLDYTKAPKHYGSIHWFDLHVKILERSGLDPQMLSQARKYTNAIRDELERREKKRNYPTILDVRERRHRYKVGIQVSDIDQHNGVPVLQVFEGYPFSKAGIREGDRILEIAHRKVQKAYDIKQALIMFDPGTEVPVKVLRHEDELFLTLLVE